MSTMYCDLSGIPVTRARLVVPYSGIWHADVTLDRAIDVSGSQLLNVAGSPWVCAVVRAIDFTGSRSVRLVGGTGGWRTTVPPKPYASPVGVPLAMVLGDVAASVGELPPSLVGYVGSPTLGTFYTRQGGVASLVLQQLLGSAWWMDATGKVQTSPRLPTPVVSPYTLAGVRGAPGIFEVATEFPADWVPGKVFAGPTLPTPTTVSRVMHVVDGASVRTEVMSWP